VKDLIAEGNVVRRAKAARPHRLAERVIPVERADGILDACEELGSGLGAS
jgi:hypothetical protein